MPWTSLLSLFHLLLSMPTLLWSASFVSRVLHSQKSSSHVFLRHTAQMAQGFKSSSTSRGPLVTRKFCFLSSKENKHDQLLSAAECLLQSLALLSWVCDISSFQSISFLCFKVWKEVSKTSVTWVLCQNKSPCSCKAFSGHLKVLSASYYSWYREDDWSKCW